MDLRPPHQTACKAPLYFKGTEGGNVLFLILIAVVLLGALSATLMRGSGDQAITQSAMRMSEALKSQSAGIRSAMLECVLVYTDASYPTTPGSGLVEDTQCVSASSGTFDIFGGFNGHFMPQEPNPFNAWEYNNDGAGTIYIHIDTDAGPAADLGVIEALRIVETGHTSDEATVVNDGVSASFRLYLTKP